MANLFFLLIAVGVVYLLYLLYFRGGNVNQVKGEINLLQTPPAVTSIIKPGSVNFTYSLWMYVNQWNSEATKLIFQGKDGVQVYHRLFMGADKPTLSFSAKNNTATATTEETTVLTDSFPLQKWVYVTIVVSGQILDFYLNGMMVKSVQTTIPPELNITQIEFGTTLDCSIRSFKRSLEPMSQDQIKTDYMAGNGSMMIQSGKSMDGRIEISRDSEVVSTIKIF